MAATTDPSTLEGTSPDGTHSSSVEDRAVAAAGESGPTGLSLRAGFVIFFGAIGFLIGRRVLGDNSFLTHLATGELILDRGAVPTTDPYSFTANGEPWVVQSWLASFLYAVLDGSVVGGAGIRVLNGLLAGGTTALVWLMTSRRTTNVFIPLGLTGTVLVLGATMWSARPLLFGLLGFALVLAVAEGLIKPVWLLPIMWVWVNTHGSFPLAGVLVGTLGVGEWLDRRSFPVDTARTFGWVVLGTLLGAINPLGPRLLWFPVQLLRRGEALDNVVEWRPFQLEGLTAWVFAGLVVAFVVSLSNRAPAAAPGLATAQRDRWRAIVPGFFFTLAALMAVRNIAVASIVLAVVTAPNLALDFGQLRLTDRGFAPRLIGLGSMALGAIALVSSLSAPLTLEGYPMTEIGALDDEGLLEGDHRLLHPEIVGNYLTLANGADANVFVDDRFDFYPQQVIDDLEVMLYGGDYAAVIDRYEPQAILWTSGGGFEAWLQARPDWVVSEPMMIQPDDGDPTAEATESEWFIARPALGSATPSPGVPASDP